MDWFQENISQLYYCVGSLWLFPWIKLSEEWGRQTLIRVTCCCKSSLFPCQTPSHERTT
jgi:hypothetical protein